MQTFYDVDLRNAQLREFAFGTPWYMMPLIGLFKLLRVPFPGTTDDPPVETLAPFEVHEATLPEEVREQIEPLAFELSRLGFHSPIYHAILYPRHATRTYWASYLHPSGRAWARIHCRIWSGESKDRVFLFPMFFSALDDGSFLVSSAAKPDMLMPEGVRMINQVGASTPALWESHERELGALLSRVPVLIGSPEQLREAMEQHHARLRDYNLDRGVFQPLSEPEPQPAVQVGPDGEEAAPVSQEDTAVFIELERLQNKKASWWNTLLILGVSLLLFMGASQLGWGWRMMGMLIPVLFFHELGHYLAMRWFGYRNVRMFFIPFLGAAVAGRHYNVPGWKKAVVALAGPVPGIVAGGALGVAGLVLDHSLLTDLALLTLILNGLNLVPLLPLDGGWVVHAILFVRHPLLDVMFRALAILSLLGLGLLAWDMILIGLSIFMLIGLLPAWRIARVAHQLREEGVAAPSPDANSIPPEAAGQILGELRSAMPQLKAPKLLATYVAQVFETLNARPPGILASLLLLTVHAGSFLAALVLCVVLVVVQQGKIGWNLAEEVGPPPIRVSWSLPRSGYIPQPKVATRTLGMQGPRSRLR